MKTHLKRLAMPRAWPIWKKGYKFVTKPNPGPHPLELCLPLILIVKEKLGIAKNAKEAKRLIHSHEVLIDGIRREEVKFPVGIMDVVEIKAVNKHFRVVLDKGKIGLIEIDKKEAEIKPCRIAGKTKIRGKTQLNLYDGKNILVEKDEYKNGDTVVISLPKQEIKEYIKLEKGCVVYLIGGKHSGDIGKVEDIMGDKVTYKTEKGDVIETLKKYVFVVGKDKLIISLIGKGAE